MEITWSPTLLSFTLFSFWNNGQWSLNNGRLGNIPASVKGMLSKVQLGVSSILQSTGIRNTALICVVSDI